MSNGYLTSCALMISIIIVILFLCKKNVNNIETKIFKYMLLLNVLESLITTTIVVVALTSNSNFLLELLNRFDVIVLLSWCSLMLYYIYNTFEVSNSKIVKKSIIILNIFMYFLALILDVNIINSNGILDSSGPLTILGLLGALFYIISMIIVMIIKYKKKNKINKIKYVPLFFLIILIILIAFLRAIVPQINFISILLSFVMLLMYHTIENPDMKIIEQLNIAKDEAYKASLAKSDFLSSMSHEIRTPLNAIVGFSEAIKNSKTLDEAKENAKDVITASNTLLEIVNGILDISKIEAGKLEINNSDYNSYKLFESVSKLIVPRMNEKGLEFRINIAQDIPKILHGDSTNLKKIITNLLTNASKYTEKGFVEFKVNCINNEDTCRLLISVEDSGRGIKKEHMEKLFNRFQRLEEDRNTTLEGTGLGLAITKKILDLMNGKIVVQSVYGKGSKFTVALDQKIVSMVDDIKEEEIKEIDLKNKKILIVDDNKLNLKVASKFLSNYNPIIETVESGIECIEKIKNKETFDIILMDIMMPKMSGEETLKELQKLDDFNIPVVALTANAVSGMREKYMSDGFIDYLSKPIDKYELKRVLSNIFFDIEEQLPEINEELEDKQNVDFLIKNGIDINKSLELLGDIETYNETLEEFYNNINNRIKKLEKSKFDLANYSIEVHALKSDSKYLGFTELAKQAYEHELKSKENDYTYINNNIDKLIEEINNIIKIIEQYL